MADLLYVMGFLTDPPALGATIHANEPHVTFLNAAIIPDKNLNSFAEQLGELVLWFKPQIVEPVLGEILMLGADQNIPATAVEKSRSLLNLHYSLLDLLSSLEGRIAEPSHHGKGWLPHVTDWVEPKTSTVNSLSLIWHKGGFGVDVENLANYYFSE